MTDRHNDARLGQAEHRLEEGKGQDPSILPYGTNVFTCPFSLPNDAGDFPATTPLEVRQISVITWWLCPDCIQAFDDTWHNQWHCLLTDANRAAAKRLYDGSYTAALNATRTPDGAAIVADAMARRTEQEVRK